MSASTRSQSIDNIRSRLEKIEREQMDGVYENILICTREHDLGKCLVENGFTSPGSLTYLNRVEIDKLTFQKTVLDPDGSGNTTTVTSHLHHGDRGLLHAAVWYFFTLSKVKYKNDPIPYPSLIRAEFEHFRTNEYQCICRTWI